MVSCTQMQTATCKRNVGNWTVTTDVNGMVTPTSVSVEVATA